MDQNESGTQNENRWNRVWIYTDGLKKRSVCLCVCVCVCLCAFLCDMLTVVWGCSGVGS